MILRDSDLKEPIKLKFKGNFNIFDNDQLFDFCVENQNFNIERTSEGELIMMSPMGSQSGNRESILISRIWNWNDTNKLGEVYSSSTGFILPNGAMRSPDVSFIKKERLESFTEEEKEKFLLLCPDFVVELRSKSDRLTDLHEKMKEWRDNGCPLSWLIDPYEEQAYIYRLNSEVEIITGLDVKLSGETILPQFELDLSEFKAKK